MKKNSVILILIFFTAVAFGARVDKHLLRDGFAVSGVDGKLIASDSNDKWLFKIDSELRDDKAVIAAGTAIELIPSSSLEKMLAYADKHPKGTYKIWGQLTRYQDENFIFSIYFLPVAAAPVHQANQQTKQKIEPVINDANDPLPLPEEILRKIKKRKIIRTVELPKLSKFKQDSVLADRTGFIVKQSNGSFAFTPDALGRRLQWVSIKLLPCQILERAVKKQADQLEQVRFKVAGILTKYKNNYYLLLQRAGTTYSHGNFGR